MDEQKNFFEVVDQICAADSRYKSDAYEFVMQALHFTQNKLKRKGHISGRELLEGIREFAIEQYGTMAKTVLRHWGITKTGDFGDVVFSLIEKKILFKTETDSIEDFKDVYDFESVFGDVVWDKIIKEVK